jgi:bifunctional non-homologous end joining protein LigD
MGMFLLVSPPLLPDGTRSQVRPAAGAKWGAGRMAGERSSEFGELVQPMLATPARELPPDGDRWAAEFKWDGLRAVAYLSAAGGVRLRSRTDRDITAAYPELAAIAQPAGRRQLILDGEIVAPGDRGRPDFAALQRRMHARQPSAQLTAAVPVRYLVFDVLQFDGRALVWEPYERRRALLEDLPLAGPAIDVPPTFPGEGRLVQAVSRQHKLEGVVLKRLDSPYLPGHRSPAWLKIKNSLIRDVIIGGWLPRNGQPTGSLGSLLLGVPGPGGLQYCGKAGTGFTETAAAALTSSLRDLEQPTSPFAGPTPPVNGGSVHWVRPVLAGQVSYTEQTPAGRLRHPSWRGLLPGTGDVRPGLPAGLAEPGDEQFGHAARVIARIATGAGAQVADAKQQPEGVLAGADLTGAGGGFEQLSAHRHEAVQEVTVQSLEAGTVGPQGRGQPVLGDQEVHEETGPTGQRGVRGGAAGQQHRPGLGAGLHLVLVDGDDEVRPGREVTVDRAHSHPGGSRDVADRCVHAGGDKHTRGCGEQGLLVAPGVGPLPRGSPSCLLSGARHHHAPLLNGAMLRILSGAPFRLP